MKNFCCEQLNLFGAVVQTLPHDFILHNKDYAENRRGTVKLGKYYIAVCTRCGFHDFTQTTIQRLQ